MKRTIEIEDNLDEIVESLIDEVKELFRSYVSENSLTEGDTPPDYGDLDYSGSIHECVDSSVPIYTAEIDGLYYLYGDQFETAYDDAGLGDGREENHKQVAIYCYLDAKVCEWFCDEAQAFFDELVSSED